MKKSMLLLVAMMALGLSAANVAFSNQAATGGVPKEGPGARPVHECGMAYQISALDEKNHNNEKGLLRTDPTNEVEVKRLKLMLLLMASLGQYRTPVQ